MAGFKTIDDIEVTDKRVLVRADLNVPLSAGKIADFSRIKRVTKTISELLERGAKVIVMSHFGRPDGKFDLSMSLGPIADGLSIATGRDVKFAVDCVGPEAENAVAKLHEGELLLLENLRFHPEEENNDPEFAKKLAGLGEVFVNDAFSCSHRAHASVVGIAQYLPAVAGRLMEEELDNLEKIFTNPEKPIAAIIGGSKVSTKLDLLNNLITKVETLIIGGAMANTFLVALKHPMGRSLYEKEMLKNAEKILEDASKMGCQIMLPNDLVAIDVFGPEAVCRVVNLDESPKIHSTQIAADIGPKSVERFSNAIRKSKTIIWNGPMGAFEFDQLDTGTLSIARVLALHTQETNAKSIAGGGDTLSAIAKSGLADQFTYLSTAGGAFLEWLEGKKLPGVAALAQTKLKNLSA